MAWFDRIPILSNIIQYCKVFPVLVLYSPALRGLKIACSTIGVCGWRKSEVLIGPGMIYRTFQGIGTSSHNQSPFHSLVGSDRWYLAVASCNLGAISAVLFQLQRPNFGLNMGVTWENHVPITYESTWLGGSGCHGYIMIPMDHGEPRNYAQSFLSTWIENDFNA